MTDAPTPRRSRAQEMATAMREAGFDVAPDMTVSGPDLARFKGWSVHQLKRWRLEGRLPKADNLARPARYDLRAVVAALAAEEIF